MRAHGPYPHGRRFRVVTVAADGSRGRRTFETEREALEYIDEFTARTTGRTVAQAVDEYLVDRARTIKERSLTTLRYRLRGILRTTEHDRRVGSLSPATGRQLLARRGSEVSTDTLVGELVAAQGWSAWCLKRGWLRRDPFVGLEVEGQRARGKAQLRIDEARRFVAVALDEGDRRGIAAAMAILMGLRASEISDRVCRDVDDGGRVLWIERAKTRKGDRHLEVPEVLRPALLALTAGRPGDARLFGAVDRHWVGYHVRRLCKVAGVPVVCPHGLRGTQSSIAVQAMPVEHVAAALGQTGPAVTRRHYLAGGAEERGRGRAALRVLQGGKTR